MIFEGFSFFKGTWGFKNGSDNKKLLKQLSKLQKTQIEKFNMFHDDIKALQSGPFYSGLMLLDDAQQPHRNTEDEKYLLKNAHLEFVKAYGILKSKQNKTPFDIHVMGVIQSYIGFNWLLLESPIDAKHHLKHAIETLTEAEKIFTADMVNLRKQIEGKHYEISYTQNRIDESIILTTINFFFPNEKLNQAKQDKRLFEEKLNEYAEAFKGSAEYKEELVLIRKNINTTLPKDTDTSENPKPDSQTESKGKSFDLSTVKSAFGKAKDSMQNSKIIESAIDSTVDVAVNKVGKKILPNKLTPKNKQDKARSEDESNLETSDKIKNSIKSKLGILSEK